MLRFLVKAVRGNEIPQEFLIYWIENVATIGTQGGSLEAPFLTKLGLDVLTEEGLLFSRAHTETQSSSNSYETGSGANTTTTQYLVETHRRCFITPAGFRAVDSDFSPILDMRVHQPPIEITNSLSRFRGDFPDITRLAFVMMQFGNSAAHQRILTGIRSALEPHGMTALRADDKQYHDDLYFNILTYIHGTRFGIAVFDRIEADSFNPNVSLEVGYMLGLTKSVCFLKERTLRTLQTDLLGKLYRTFDAQNPEGTIPPELFTWMDQKGYIVRR